MGVEQRANAEPVPCQQQRAVPTIVEREGELPDQPLQHADAPRLVPVDQHFGVAVRRKPVPQLQEIRAQLAVVEDLAVEHDLQLPILVAERLGPAGEVDDREAGVDQADAAVGEDAEAVGPPMADRTGHLPQAEVGDVPRFGESQPGDAAHQVTGPSAGGGPSRATGATSSGPVCRYRVVSRFWRMSR